MASSSGWRVCLIVTMLVLAATPDRSEACSLAIQPGPTSVPADGETTGPMPLMLTWEGTSPYLRAVDAPDVEIAVVPDAIVPDAFGMPQALRGWRPAAPLPAGRYQWHGLTNLDGPDDFFVDVGAKPTAPATREITLRVTLDEPDEDQGGVGCGGATTSCDDVDFTRLELALAPVAQGETAPVVYLVELTPRSGETRRALVSAPSGSGGEATIALWDRPGGLPSFKAGRTCVAVTPIGDDGEVGARLDLGCVRPDGDDPRVVDTRGCAGGGAPTDPWWLFAAVACLATRARLGQAT